ncbi:phenylalanine--tRNA ligase subunit beta, partial [Patescibacteria group bacterium]|nr:phenylalanine--tRNA ligase subunit beta [Patescibacteria group bacterium]
MKISLNWLKQYIDLPKNITPKKLAEDLIMSTVEVESIKNQAEEFENIVVGKIVKLKKHPNADKLKIVMTDIGQPEPVQIVCGGANLKQGMFVAVALPGAKVKWHGQGEPVVLEKVKIRGQESFGMICASNEIGLENRFPCGEMSRNSAGSRSTAGEILDLNKIVQSKTLNQQIGQNLSEALGFNDVIIEIENKSLTNRPDLWSHYGIARELSAIYNLPLCHPELVSGSNIKSRNKFGMTVKIQDENLCSRYIGCVVKNIKIAPSPEWMQKRLEAVGLRAINNIVDITNYVLMDVGQPTHAFNKTLIHTDVNTDKTQIIIRNAKKGEKIQSLDGEERELDENMLVIADSEKPIAIAGIIGGANSEIDKNTTEIILESATFNAMSVRKTSQKLNLRTEAEIRFEKNLDSNLAETAMLRMLYLIKKIIPESEITEYIDEFPVKPKNKIIKINHDFIEKRIGQKFNSEEIIKILSRLGFKVEESNGAYKILVPSWRATGDVSIPEDIVEEVARIYGYDNLKEKVEMIEMDKAKYQLEFDLENKIKNYLSLGCGMNEVFNYPWADEKILDKLGLSSDKIIEIANPPAQENRFLQSSLIPNLIKNVQDNLRYFSEFKLFELARVFKSGQDKSFGDDVLAEQPKMLAGAIVFRDDIFFEIKGVVEGALKELRIMNYELRIGKATPFLNQDKNLGIFINDEE